MPCASTAPPGQVESFPLINAMPSVTRGRKDPCMHVELMSGYTVHVYVPRAIGDVVIVLKNLSMLVPDLVIKMIFTRSVLKAFCSFCCHCCLCLKTNCKSFNHMSEETSVICI